MSELHEGQLFDRDEIGHDVRAQIGREAGSHGTGEILVEDADGAELILGDAVRTAEVVGLGAEKAVFVVVGIAQVAEGGIDLFLGLNAFGGQKCSPVR